MSKHLYVGNLSAEITEPTLREAFARDGRTVEEVTIVSNAKGRPRGFAFVALGSSEEAQAAIAALNGAELLGKPLKVREAGPRPEPRIAEAITGRGRGNKKGGRR